MESISVHPIKIMSPRNISLYQFFKSLFAIAEVDFKLRMHLYYILGRTKRIMMIWHVKHLFKKRSILSMQCHASSHIFQSPTIGNPVILNVHEFDRRPVKMLPHTSKSSKFSCTFSIFSKLQKSAYFPFSASTPYSLRSTPLPSLAPTSLYCGVRPTLYDSGNFNIPV